MELKPYQKYVLDDLSRFLVFLERYGDTSAAFHAFWEDQLGKRSYGKATVSPPYHKQDDGKVLFPQVCIKVPTAGGKTFIACNALERLFAARNTTAPKAVVWLVPGLTIMEQTLKNLRNPAHPYRQRIDAHFQHRVEVYDKKQLLEGASFNPSNVREQLSIMVLSFDSFRANNKETRKIFQENGALAPFARNPIAKGTKNPYHDPSSLLNVIRQLNPVVIVDESHNAVTDLSVEMLENLNPSFVLELTATPRSSSNIISYVDAFALKKEHMIKLPVIVYNHRDKTEVIQSALQLQHRLEMKAQEAARNGKKSIRPIVLFQAESNTNEERTTFNKIKASLLELNIPDEEIKIKTATINELKGVDLMATDCPVRYIITVNALKEGWDCPFAYILASLADRSSAVDVEQILGRVLRQPYAQKHTEPLLNLSYVLTASARFTETLDNIVAGLNRAGFSDRDFKLSKDAKQDEDPLESLFLSDTDDSIDTAAIISQKLEPTSAVAEIEASAIASHEAYQTASNNNLRTGAALPSSFLRERANCYYIKEVFADVALQLKIPKLFTEIPLMPRFHEDFPWELLHRGKLLETFQLSQANSQINFDKSRGSMVKLDTEQTGPSNYIISRQRVQGKLFDALAAQISTMSIDTQRLQLAEMMYNLVQDYMSIDDKQIREYMQRVVNQLDPSQYSDALGRRYEYKRIIETKIGTEALQFAEDRFYAMCDTEDIHAIPHYSFPDFIVPREVENGIPIAKSLYHSEGSMNGFERDAILAIASLPNVLFWHRVLSRKPDSFFINGFINHYPDFIVVTTGGTILLVETKGDDRDNLDSRKKNKMGRKWAELAGKGYKYFMIFKDKQPEDAFSLSHAIDQISKLA